MKRQIKLCLLCLLAFVLCAVAFVGCSEKKSASATDATNPLVYINGNGVAFNKEGDTDLSLLSVEKGVTINVMKVKGTKVSVNGQAVDSKITLDIGAITRDEVLEFEVTTPKETKTYKLNLMPTTFPDYTTEGESATDGDYYLSTYDMEQNYIFKLNGSGELIFYKAITKTNKSGKEVNTNALDFQKHYTSEGEVRYTYMPYLAGAFANGDCQGINPGCVVVMDENYKVIDELYCTDEKGEAMMIDPHGFVWLDEDHYILAGYKQMTLDVPKDLGATDNKADLAVLIIQEIQEGEVHWEFNSADYEQFLYESNSVNWKESTKRCYDYVHFNSMAIDADNNLLVSCRHLDAILKIDREGGSLMWQLGGDYDEFGLEEDQKFSYQHSIVVAENGDYLLFDNANTAVENKTAEASSVIRMTIVEEDRVVTSYQRHNVQDYFSIYMGAIRELDAANGVYLYSVGGNYEIDKKNPPEWSMIEYTVNEDGTVARNFCFRANEGFRRLYSANKCK